MAVSGTPDFLSVSYYQSLITSEYQGSTKFLGWLAGVLGPLNDASIAVSALTPTFDLDSATSAQLNVIGQIVGQSRTVGFQPSNNVSPILDDTTYRTLLRARVAQNQWTGTIDALQGIWQMLFPGGQIVIQDQQNMSATIILSGVFTSILQDLIVNGYIVPRPEGVLYNYVFSALPAFGFDQSSAYIAGFNQGHWT